jgi:1-acyl-sn-glycerol-3-phosphate acyltransferase
VINPEKIPGAGRFVYCFNHLSLFDIPVFMDLLHFPVTVLAKEELFRIPFFGYSARIADIIPLKRQQHREAVQTVNETAETLRRTGIPLVIFPEGTRSKTGLLGHFKKGPFHLARAAGYKIVPAAISGTFEIKPKTSWRIRGGDVLVKFGDVIDPETEASTETIRDQTRDAIERLSRELAAEKK